MKIDISKITVSIEAYYSDQYQTTHSNITKGDIPLGEGGQRGRQQGNMIYEEEEEEEEESNERESKEEEDQNKIHTLTHSLITIAMIHLIMIIFKYSMRSRTYSSSKYAQIYLITIIIDIHVSI